MPLHLLIAHLVASTTSTTAKSSSSKSSGSSYFFLVVIALFVLAYFLFIRPRSQRMRQQQTSQRQIAIGDEVMSAGGIFGRVVALDADEVEVEVSPGVVLTFIRRAVSLRQPQAGPGAPAAGSRWRTGGAAAAVTEPVDDPWDVEPDGPGDQAGDPEPPTPPGSGWPGPSGEADQGPHATGD